MRRFGLTLVGLCCVLLLAYQGTALALGEETGGGEPQGSEKPAPPSPMALALLDLARDMVAKGEVDTATQAVSRALELAPGLLETIAADPVLADLGPVPETRPTPTPTPAPKEKGGESLDLWLTGAQVWSSPTYSEGAVYFGSDDGVLYSLALDPLMPRWKVIVGGRIRTTPAVSGTRVLFASDNGFLYCVNSNDGSELWSFDLGSAAVPRVLPSPYPPYDYDFLSSSPVVSGDLVLVGSADGHLYAVELASGKKKWQRRTEGKVRSTPVVADGIVYFGSWDHQIYALDVDQGKEIWRFDTGGIVQSTPAVGGGLLYVGSRSGALFALNAQTGEFVWRLDLEDGSWVESSAVYRDGSVYVGSSDALRLFALNAENGEIRWAYETGGWSWCTPTVTDDTVYIGVVSAYPYYKKGLNLRHGLHAVDRSTGEKRWLIETEQLPGYLTGGVVSSPVVVDGMVVFGSLDNHLHVVRE